MSDHRVGLSFELLRSLQKGCLKVLRRRRYSSQPFFEVILKTFPKIPVHFSRHSTYNVGDNYGYREPTGKPQDRQMMTQGYDDEAGAQRVSKHIRKMQIEHLSQCIKDKLPSELQKHCLHYIPFMGLTAEKLEKARKQLKPVSGMARITSMLSPWFGRVLRLPSGKTYKITKERQLIYYAKYYDPFRGRWYPVASIYIGDGEYRSLWIDKSAMWFCEWEFETEQHLYDSETIRLILLEACNGEQGLISSEQQDCDYWNQRAEPLLRHGNNTVSKTSSILPGSGLGLRKADPRAIDEIQRFYLPRTERATMIIRQKHGSVRERKFLVRSARVWIEPADKVGVGGRNEKYEVGTGCEIAAYHHIMRNVALEVVDGIRSRDGEVVEGLSSLVNLKDSDVVQQELVDHVEDRAFGPP